jgi:hypothetical protein
MFRKRLPLILLLLFSIGCGSAVPMATTHPWDTQRKMQAARHWEILAGDLARQVKKCIKKRDDLNWRPVYVAPGKNSPFEEIFRGLLMSELTDRGLTVSKTEENALKMEYSAQLLEHSDRYYQKFPMKFTALSAGVIVARNFDLVDNWIDRQQTEHLLAWSTPVGALADVAMSRYAGEPSHNEVVITTTLSLDDTLYLHQSDIYYINDPDTDHYAGENQIELNGRTYHVAE